MKYILLYYNISGIYAICPDRAYRPIMPLKCIAVKWLPPAMASFAMLLQGIYYPFRQTIDKKPDITP